MKTRTSRLILAVFMSFLGVGCDNDTGNGNATMADTSDAATDATEDARSDSGGAADVADAAADVSTDITVDMNAMDGVGQDARNERCPTTEVAADGLAVIEQGAVQGTRVGDSWVYRGVPYTAPPVGDLRWQAPQQADCFTGTHVANEFGSACMQVRSDGTVDGSEDCLTLNVWAPLAPPASPRAVMVFLHGGGNQVGQSANPGDGDDPLINGRVFVEQEEVIFVSLNYRIGALGFLAHPALSAEDPQGVSGNYGLLDQIAALQWVRDNIAAFGGDPERVMLFGESAGAFDVCALMTSPASVGLFHRALMESGNCNQPTLAEREARHVAFMEPLGCDANADANCLRTVTAQALTAAQGPLSIAGNGGSFELNAALNWGPAVDGVVLQESPDAAFQGGRQHDVPFVIGSNADEMTFFLLLSNISQQDFLDFVDLVFGPGNQAEILTYYDRMGLEAWRRPAIELTTDLYFTCEARRIARWAAASQNAPVYRYYFTWFIDNALGRPAGATHALELPLLFQRRSIGTYDFAPEEVALSEAMLRYWARFAITGDPNGGPDPAWPAYAASSDPAIQLATPPTEIDGVDTAECDLIDSLLGFPPN